MNTNQRRVVVVYWKERAGGSFEVYSSLKNFCLAAPGYSYNTISNYLSKRKIAYEDRQIRIERQVVITERPKKRAIAAIVVKKRLGDADEKDDLAYWLTKTPAERVAAAAHLSTGLLKKGVRMDRTKVKKRTLTQDAVS